MHPHISAGEVVWALVWTPMFARTGERSSHPVLEITYWVTGCPLGRNGCLGDAVQNRQLIGRYGFLTFSA